MRQEAKVEAASPPLKPDDKRQDAASIFPNRYRDFFSPKGKRGSPRKFSAGEHPG
jgi:hypothetical protein